MTSFISWVCTGVLLKVIPFVSIDGVGVRSRQGLADHIRNDDLGGAGIAGLGFLDKFADDVRKRLHRNSVAKNSLEHPRTMPGVRIPRGLWIAHGELPLSISIIGSRFLRSCLLFGQGWL